MERNRIQRVYQDGKGEEMESERRWRERGFIEFTKVERGRRWKVRGDG